MIFIMKDRIVQNKSFDFSITIVDLYKELINKREYVISKQILRSGISIGANISEAQKAESRKDFIHKYYIALKETNETDYWLSLLFATRYISKNDYLKLSNACIEIIKLLTAIINKTKATSIK